MMKARIFLCFLAMGVALTTMAQAQLDVSTIKTEVDPVTKLAPDKWVTLATAIMNGKSIVGKPEIFMINATGQELSAVTCDGKWQLVGPKPYIKDAPSTLPPWKITLVPTEGFDSYCKQSIVAQSDSGILYKATLISVDGTFTNASFLTFRLPQ